MNTKVIIWLFSLLYLFFVVRAVALFSVPLMLAMAVLPFFIRAALCLNLVVFAPVALLASRLAFPGGGYGANISLFNVATAFACAVMLLDRLMRQKKLFAANIPNFCAIGFLLWVFFLMIYRGTGLRILGSPLHGGATYLHVIFSFMYFILASSHVSNVKAIQKTAMCMAILPITSFALLGFFIFSGGRFTLPLAFVLVGDSETHAALSFQMGVANRVITLTHFRHLMWLCVFNIRRLRFLRVPPVVFILISTVAVGLAGYRSVLILHLCWIWFFYYTKTRKRTIYLIVTACLVIGCVILLQFLYPYLPFGLQRSLAFMSGNQHGLSAVAAAARTEDWRYTIWRRAIADIPRYWLVGRGVAYAFRSLGNLMYQGFLNPEFAYATGRFHQALLEIIVLYGLPALLLLVLMFFHIAHKRFLPLFRYWDRADTWRIWKTGLASYITVYFFVWFVFGQSQEILTSLPVYLALFRILENTENVESARVVNVFCTSRNWTMATNRIV